MPLVFVHGVSVRKDEQYVDHEAARNELFRRIALRGIVGDPSLTAIQSPYWGDLGATLRWKGASLPTNDFENFGLLDGSYERLCYELGLDLVNERQMLLTIARQDFAAAVDLLWTAASLSLESGKGAEFGRLGAFVATYARGDPKPGWLSEIKDDVEFTARLGIEVDKLDAAASPAGGLEAFGSLSNVWSTVKKSASRLADAAAAVGLNPVIRKVRPWLNDGASRFLGDVFEYLKERGEPGREGPIVRVVGDALEQAHKVCKPPTDPLIVVAHSMGGNICYDILATFRPHLHVNYFLTVGSQVGLFEELKLFKGSDRTVPSADVPRARMPANIHTWHNVFDRADILGYASSKVFEGVEDFDFDTHSTVFTAHAAYFERPTFHERLNLRLREMKG